MDIALPNPSGFRTVILPESAPARLFAARLVHEGVDFNYSDLEGQHQFVFPARFYRVVTEITHEVVYAKEKSRYDATAQMARTLRRALIHSRIPDIEISGVQS